MNEERGCSFCKGKVDHYTHCIWVKAMLVPSHEEHNPWPLDAEMRIRTLEKLVDDLLKRKPSSQDAGR